MQFVVFILVYPIIWLISLLPLRILYVFSDFIYFLIYYVFGYRKKVVFQNLKLAFPNKTEKELKKIQKKFFHHFVDIFIEMIKSFTISEKELKKRYQFSNVELIQNIEKNNKSIILMGSHYANWEWVFILNKFTNFNGIAAYTKINNPYFDKNVRSSRGRFGTKLIETKKLIQLLIDNKNNNMLSMYGLLSDQSPQLHKAKYFTEFMGVKVPIHTGSEFLAKKYDFSVVMIKTKKIKRGYYKTELKMLAENSIDFKDYEITDLFLRELENQIKEKPEHYFWSHKRWKHKDKVPNSKT